MTAQLMTKLTKPTEMEASGCQRRNMSKGYKNMEATLTHMGFQATLQLVNMVLDKTSSTTSKWAKLQPVFKHDIFQLLIGLPIFLVSN